MSTGSPDKQVNKNKHFTQAFRHACSGIWQVLMTERNMRFHLSASIVVIIMGFIFHITASNWLWILLAIFLVFTAEFMNTIAEGFCDMIVGHKFDVNVKKIKDVSAGGVLIAALFAVIVGLIIFVPRIMDLIGG